MDSYITGNTIKRLRTAAGLTQSELAYKVGVSDKAVSKWETGKGYPDISLLDTLANALSVSVSELISGNTVQNRNRSFNMKRSVFYVCPVCGNVTVSTGETLICCHGITLPPLTAEENDKNHKFIIENIEDEYYVTVPHEMSKEHYISFIAAVSDNGINIIKQYPESTAEARFKRGRVDALCIYCNRHGLFLQKLK